MYEASPVPGEKKMSGVPGAGACITSVVAIKLASKGTGFLGLFF